MNLEELRQELAAYLNCHNVPAVTAWDHLPRQRQNTAVVVVSLRACEGGPAGFQDFLGDHYDPDTKTWYELYGRRAEITFGLDVWGPRSGSEADCAELFSRTAQALTIGCPDGLKLHKVSCGETSFDLQENRFHCPAQAIGTVFLLAYADENGLFTDFIVKGSLL